MRLVQQRPSEVQLSAGLSNETNEEINKMGVSQGPPLSPCLSISFSIRKSGLVHHRVGLTKKAINVKHKGGMCSCLTTCAIV